MSGLISKIKSGVLNSPPTPEANPITNYFEVGKQTCNAGPGLMWQVHDAYRISDRKECSVFFLDKRTAEKLYRPKRKETLLERVRWCVSSLAKVRHPKMLQILHVVEEGTYTIAFAAEGVIGCLHNILAWHEAHGDPGLPPPIMPYPPARVPTPPPGPQAPPPADEPDPQLNVREYHFLDIELRYGLLQIIEGLQYMHYNLHQVHRNICPQAIIVTKKGTWKLFGLEFMETTTKDDPSEILSVPPWSVKYGKLAQPDLDYLAPEVQLYGECSILSDMFSLGLVMCTLFNNGNALIQANNNPVLYMRQIDYLEHQVDQLLPRVPVALQEAVQRLVTRDPHPRPTTQLLPLINYFKSSNEPAIAALQFLDIITRKTVDAKAVFYRTELLEALPYIPKKLRWQHVWPNVHLEVRCAEVLEDVLLPILWLSNDASQEEFSNLVLPTVKQLFTISRDLLNQPKSIEAAVMVLENLHVFVKKCQKNDINKVLLPMLYSVLEADQMRMQFDLLIASLIAMQNVADYIEDKPLHNIALSRARYLVERFPGDVKITNLTLSFYEKVLLRLERNHVLEQVIPTLLAMRLSDPDIVTRIVRLYKSMLFERKLGLTTNVMATKMIPALAPQTVNPALNVEQFSSLMEILYDMLENIDTNQRYRLKIDNYGHQSPERNRALRHQTSTDNMNAPAFNIPNLRLEKRKTSSAEDMARKNSITAPTPTGSVGGLKSTGIGQWFMGLNNPSNNDGNFLRVSNILPIRRLSDNTLLTPKIRIAPSCASSPGGTPGGSSTGLPTRRHSSIGPQERRSSAVNLSPPTGYQYRGRSGGSGSSLSVPSTSRCGAGSVPNTSSSVPYLLTSSMQSIRSRRQSAGMSGSQGSGILQQISSGVVRHLPGGTSNAPHPQLTTRWSALQGATTAGYNALHHTAMAVRKCPSLNITLTR